MHVSELFAQTYSPQLVRVEAVAKDGLHKWMSNPDFTPEVDGDSVLLHVNNFDQLMFSWASDTYRLLIAARSTLQAISSTNDKPNATAWILIKAYYASFYYAHVALRLSRVSLTYSPTSELIKLRDLMDAYSLDSPFPLKTNQYLFKYSERERHVRVTQKSNRVTTHERTWITFLELLSENTHFALKANDADNDNDAVNELASLLRTSVSYNKDDQHYLSSFRNEVQYTQKHGVWPPYHSKLRTDYCLRALKRLQSSKASAESFDLDSPDIATRNLNRCFFICRSIESFIALIVQHEKKSFLKKIMPVAEK